jgi:hypothetical protein
MLGGQEVELMAKIFALLRGHLCGLQGVGSNYVFVFDGMVYLRREEQ